MITTPAPVTPARPDRGTLAPHGPARL